MSDVERFHSALDDIANHFDDQGFPSHDTNTCASIIVNFASAVFWDGYEGYMGDWYTEQERRWT